MNQALSAKIIESVLVCLRLGYRRIHDLLRPQFEDVNHKRMLRLPEMASGHGVEDDVLKQCLKSQAVEMNCKGTSIARRRPRSQAFAPCVLDLTTWRFKPGDPQQRLVSDLIWPRLP